MRLPLMLSGRTYVGQLPPSSAPAPEAPSLLDQPMTPETPPTTPTTTIVRSSRGRPKVLTSAAELAQVEALLKVRPPLHLGEIAQLMSVSVTTIFRIMEAQIDPDVVRAYNESKRSTPPWLRVSGRMETLGALLNTGASYAMIADTMGVSAQTVSSATHKLFPEEAAKRKPGRKPSNRHDMERMRELLVDPDNTYEMVGAEFGITRERVRQLLVSKMADVYGQRNDRRAQVLAEKSRLSREANERRYETRTCVVCQRKFEGLRATDFHDGGRFCSRKCRYLWVIYLRYYLDFPRHQVAMSRCALRAHEENPSLYETSYGQRARVNHARRVMAEYEATGTVTRKRNLSRGQPPYTALALAEQIGIDLIETRDRLCAEAGVSVVAAVSHKEGE